MNEATIALCKTEGNVVGKTERNIRGMTEGNIVERVVVPVVTAFWGNLIARSCW